MIDPVRGAEELLARVRREAAAPGPGRAPVRWLPVGGGTTGAWALHLQTWRICWDAGSERLFGPREGETPAETWRRVIHPADRERVAAGLMGVDDRVMTFRIRSDDGPERFLLSRVTHVLSGEPRTWIAGTTVDVTSSRDIALRAEVVLETSTDVFFCLDAQDRFTYLNRPAADALERSAGDLIGRTFFEALPHLVGPVARAAHERVRATGEPATFEDQHPDSGVWYECTVRAVHDGLHVLVRDITERHAADAEQARLLGALAHQAAHDALTGLANRTQLIERLSAHLEQRRGATATVLFLDLDRFKLVNDTLGHPAGDELLRVVAGRLSRLRAPVVARIGGDEFVLVLLDASEGAAEAVAAQVLRALGEPVALLGQDLHVSASIGMARGGAGTSAETLLRDADLALYRAKGAGRSQAAWYDEALHSDVVRRVGLERDLRAALETAGAEHGELELHYQPSYSLSTGAPTGVEALLRWEHPLRGAVPPSQSIPVAEDSGLVLPLGAWVVRTAADQAASWAGVPDLTTWVNVSPRQVSAGDLVGLLERELARTGLPAHRLGIEVTESVLVERSRAVDVLEQVRALGVRVGIDDFGTGYSSLARLAELPVDLVKVDRRFVAASGTPAGAAVLDGIITVVHGMGATVIAEGVETPEQLDLLRASACDAASGYLLARPTPAASTHLGSTRLPEVGTAPRGAGVKNGAVLPIGAP